jgi:hypothetical protein
MPHKPKFLTSRRQVMTAFGLTGLALAVPNCLVGAAARAEDMPSSEGWTGERLFKVVRDYSGMGNHRVGTPVDAATNSWFAEQLQAMGAEVELQPIKFDRFDGTTEVTIDGETIPSMPLYYEAVGEARSDAPHLAALKATTGDGPSQAFLDEIAKAKAAGAAIAVIATEGAGGELSTPNCYPKLGSGMPTALVPGRFAEALAKGKVTARFSGSIVPGESNNVVARFGDPDDAPLVIATPLSGWFTCAAERGTGIAVALALAEEFGRNRPVLVVGSPGHEILHHIGLEEYLKSNQVAASLILHLGANVAVGLKDPATGRVNLAPGLSNPKEIPEAGRTVFVRMDEVRFSKIEPELASADLPAVLNPPSWNGEGALWANASPASLMSFTGIHPLFHTSGDVPENTTSPEALATVYQAVARAVSRYF